MTVCSQVRPSASSMQTDIRFAAERPQDRAVVDALIDHAFGPGRFAKTAERLREGATAHPELSVCAFEGEALIGAVRLWPARIGDLPIIFLGPIAVQAEHRGHGLGAELVEHALARARALEEPGMILVGDMGFFGPLGFEPVPAGRVSLPGPVDPGRMLWLALFPGALDGATGRLASGRLASGRLASGRLAAVSA